MSSEIARHCNCVRVHRGKLLHEGECGRDVFGTVVIPEKQIDYAFCDSCFSIWVMEIGSTVTVVDALMRLEQIVALAKEIEKESKTK